MTTMPHAGLVLPPEPSRRHRCAPPVGGGYGRARPLVEPGSTWACPSCRRVWVVVDDYVEQLRLGGAIELPTREWRRASWRTARAHRRRIR